jgi:cytochrome c2
MRVPGFKLSTLLVCLFVIGSGAGLRAASPVIGALASHPDLDSATKGMVLIGELNCAACHDLGENEKWIQSKPAPKLQNVRSRLRFDWLRDYVQNPHSIKPGVTMPDVLAGLGDAKKNGVAEAITQYLFSLQRDREPIDLAQRGSEEVGKMLYESIGCVACHSPEKHLPGSVPLGSVASKYSPDGLVTFLKNPLESHPGGRMPDFGLSHREAIDIATYLLRGESIQTDAFAPKPSLVSEGREQFVERRCVACHQVDDSQISHNQDRTRIANLDAGCLSGDIGDWPDYSLSDNQVGTIRSVLAQPVPKLDNEQQIQLTMLNFNCVACHERNGFGDIAEDRDEWFSTNDPNIGEQGRVPPSLTNVGAKLNPDAIRKILVEGAPVRPYLKTRMPQFGSSNLNHLITLFDETDQLPAVGDVEIGTLDDFKNSGKKLAGNEVFNCIACHAFKGKKSGNMAVVDLTEMSLRLKKNWFVQYLQNPQVFSPSTVMPGFWAGGKSGFTEMFEGDAQPQIQAIWAYLQDGYGASEPRGMHREPMRILATDEAKMLRRSYQETGKRGIGVGYPGQVNLIFNSEQLCLSAIWKGEFLDPAGVWTSQGHGTARSLGQRISLTNEPELTRLDTINGPWPVAGDRPEHLRFKGYELDRKQRPTFDYTYDNIAVSDYCIEKVPSDAGKSGLERTITFKDMGHPIENLVFRAAVSDSIVRVSGDTFNIGGELTIRIRSKETPLLVKGNGKTELRVPIKFSNGNNELLIDYVW